MKAGIILTVLASLLCAAHSAACPLVGGIPDFNCDGIIKIAVLGDSIVYGTGDTNNRGEGGYVLRAQRVLPLVKFFRGGVKGLQTRGLIKSLNNAFSRGTGPKVRAGVIDADYVVLDIGRNDFWLREPIAGTYRNLNRIEKIIYDGVLAAGHLPPLVIKAALLLPHRSFQIKWVEKLNSMIIGGHSLAHPADLRFDYVDGEGLLSWDNLHPTSRGYAEISKVLTRYLKTRLESRVARLHPDRDHDGVADFFEESECGTSTSSADTNDDGVSDLNQCFPNA